MKQSNQQPKLVEVRVWAATEDVEQVAELIIESAEEKGFRFIKKSPPLRNRPPKQHESRIHLTFEDVRN